MIHGAKKGQKQPRQPHIAKDDLVSTSYFKGLYGLAEGEIAGLADGGKSIRLDGTPLINANGQPNFKGVTWDFRTGTLDQEHIAGFSAVENERNVGVELRHDRPYVQMINNVSLSAVRLRLNFNALREQKDNGDITGYAISYAIDVQTDGGAFTQVLSNTVRGKASQGFKKSHRIELPKATKNWTIRVRRITPNRDSDLIADTVSIDAITEIIDAKLRYPATALLGLTYDATTFSNIAKLAVRLKGKLIKVPSNYNPVARTYSGLWDGTFKLAYSNNPAWVLYDICTHKRYGLGERLSNMVDKWRLYQIAQYCDEPVDDGKGGKEPRFAVNVYIQQDDDAYKVIQNIASVFRGLSYWDGTQVIVDSDTPKDPVYTFSAANVVGGEFSYTGTRQRDRHTVVKVAWDNPDNDYKTEYELIRDEQGIAKYGIRMLDIGAFGCTSQSQAQRAGLWALKSEQLETRTVSFKTGLQGFIPQVGQVINIADNVFAGRAISGRVVSHNAQSITLDRMAGKVGDSIIIGTQTAKITAVNGTAITTDKALTINDDAVWAIVSDDLKLMQFRILTIAQDDDATFSITALQYERQKYDAIDSGAVITPKPITALTATPITAPSSVTISQSVRTHQNQSVTTMTINWTQVQGAVAYQVRWRKDDGNWQNIAKISGQSVDIDGVYSGNYIAEVQAIDAFDNESLATSSQLTTITGKVGKPPRPARLTATGKLFGMELAWPFNAGSDDTAYTEIQVSPDSRSNIATLGTFAYPTNKHEITGLQGNLTQHYRARIVDKLGNTSDWTDWVSGKTEAQADKVLNLLQGQITASQLHQDLSTPIGKIGGIESGLASARFDINKAVSDIGTERNRISQAIADITVLQTANNAKTQELANLTQTVGTHTSSINSLAVTTGDLSQKYTQLKTASENANSEITAIKQTQNGQATQISTLGSRFDSLSVGGRNYLTKASFGGWYNGTWRDYRFVISDKNIAGPRFTRADAIEQGADVVFSFKIAKKSGRITSIGGHTHSLSHHQIYIDGVLVGNNFNAGVAYPDDLAVHHIVIKAKDHFATESSDKALYIQPNRGSNGYADVYSCEIWDCKLERGNVATDWSPAPEDVDAKFTQTNANISTLQQTVTNADSALSQRITALDTAYKSADNALSARVATAEQSITTANQAIAQTQQTLTAKIDGLSVGGRNLILNSKQTLTVPAGGASNKESQQIIMSVANIDWTKVKQLTLSVDVKHADDLVRAGNRWWRIALESVARHADGTSSWPKAMITAPVATAFNGRITYVWDVPKEIRTIDYAVIFVQNINSNHDIIIANAKLEIGNIATDWTPAPEDVDSATSAVQANLDEFKTAQVSKDNATAQSISTLQTTVNGQTASIQQHSQSINGLSAQYTVKVQTGGIVSGIGLMSSNGVSAFAVRADQFYIAPPTGTTKGVLPFTVQTTPSTVNGVSVPAGTYIDNAFIANGSIGNAHIANGAITTAKIGNAQIGNAQIANGAITTAKIGTAQVDTLQIAGEAVVVPRLQFTESVFEFYNIDTEVTINSVTMDAKGGAVSISFGFEHLYARAGGNNDGSGGRVIMRIKRGNTVLRMLNFVKNGEVLWAANIYQATITAEWVTIPTLVDVPPSGDQTYTVTLESRGLNAGKSSNDTALYPVKITARSLHVMGVKR